MRGQVEIGTAAQRWVTGKLPVADDRSWPLRADGRSAVKLPPEPCIFLRRLRLGVDG